jgi:hypothetical protein
MQLIFRNNTIPDIGFFSEKKCFTPKNIAFMRGKSNFWLIIELFPEKQLFLPGYPC